MQKCSSQTIEGRRHKAEGNRQKAEDLLADCRRPACRLQKAECVPLAHADIKQVHLVADLLQVLDVHEAVVVEEALVAVPGALHALLRLVEILGEENRHL